MLTTIFINSFLKRVDENKAIIIAKQFNIDFSIDEMKIALPFMKQNWQLLIDTNKKSYLLNYIANNYSIDLSKKIENLMDKLIIILV